MLASSVVGVLLVLDHWLTYILAKKVGVEHEKNSCAKRMWKRWGLWWGSVIPLLPAFAGYSISLTVLAVVMPEAFWFAFGLLSGVYAVAIGIEVHDLRVLRAGGRVEGPLGKQAE
jgi:hypothetical protein